MTICSRSGEEQKPKVGKRAPVALAWMLLLAAGAAYSQDQPAPATQPVSPAPDQSASPAPSTMRVTADAQAVASGSAPMRVMVGHSRLIKTSGGERVSRVVVTDPAVATVIALAPGNQILVNGVAAGEVSLLIWDDLGRERSYELRVDVDISACAEEEKRIYPDEQINVTSSRSAIVLSGHVSTKDVADRAEKIALAYTTKVVNVLSFGPVGSQEVLLSVIFAEVDRTALTQLGANLFLPGEGHTIAVSQTQQFGGVSISNSAQTTTTNGNSTTTTQTPTAPTANISNFLNLFIFRSDINLGAVIQALQEKSVLQILAEPTVPAMNGKEASFLAGGQFPFPVVQPGQGFSAVTITFKNFGVELKYTPEIMPNGNIHLHVVPSVSTLDFSNALTISGFTIPAISTRSVDTEFEVQDGQSFVIAGLLDNRVTDIMNKVPWLGDIPILGDFFKSKSAQKSRTELMVLCTVRKIDANSQPPILPTQPVPFLDKSQFDSPKAPHAK
jgi:pilus assembly protein CpaC